MSLVLSCSVENSVVANLSVSCRSGLFVRGQNRNGIEHSTPNESNLAFASLVYRSSTLEVLFEDVNRLNQHREYYNMLK